MEIKITTPPQFYHCEKGWRWNPPPFTDFDLWWVVDGVGNLRLDGQDYPIETGSCFVFLPGSQVVGTQDPMRRLAVFAVHFVVRDESPKWQSPGQKIRDAVWFNMLAQRSITCRQRQDAVGREQSRLCVVQMLLQLLEEASLPPASPADARLLEVANAIQRRPGATWYVDQMARTVHLSRAQFVRRFQALTGQPPARFVIQTRLERARQLIGETDMKLSQIAEALGYPDLYFFSRQYKRYFGHAPSGARAGAIRLAGTGRRR